ncbi:unnamed protein product [Amoebophrya sp. A25]|nr:unnamed protein product [Amoebophrya sp. A25]|eukprot:GSA25T00017791001.1
MSEDEDPSSWLVSYGATAEVIADNLSDLHQLAGKLDEAEGVCFRDAFCMPPLEAITLGNHETPGVIKNQRRSCPEEAGHEEERRASCAADGEEQSRSNHKNEAVYLVGHSLGLQPRETSTLVQAELKKWANVGVNGHFSGEFPWMPIDEFANPLAATVVGAKAEEVCMMNTLSVNLHLMFTTFYRPQAAGRYKIVYEEQAFPSDYFAFESQARLHDLDPSKALLALPPDPETDVVDEEALLELLRTDESIAVVCLGALQYYSGQLFDVERITRVAHENGVIALFDLAHAVGNVPLKLHDWNVDAACFCTYKYLNSGPGSIGGFFVHERHFKEGYDESGPGAVPSQKRLLGWWAHDKSTRFEMKHELKAATGAQAFSLSNPGVLLMMCAIASLRVFDRTSMQRLRLRSERLTLFLWRILEGVLEQESQKFGASSKLFSIVTPAERGKRGSMLTIKFADGDLCRMVHAAIEKKGVVIDYRSPDALRITPVALYNTFGDLARFAEIFSEELAELAAP